VELEVRPPLAASGHAALARALAAAGVLVDGQPRGYRSLWRREGLLEATSPGDDLRALSAQHAGRDAGVVEP
jgi:hypothetical protein